jgi:hypothetical protein
MQFFGDLTSRLTAANDQYVSGWQCFRIGVPIEIDQHQPIWQSIGSGWPVWSLKRAGRKDERIGTILIGVCLDQESDAVPAGSINRNAFKDRGIETASVAFKICDDLITRHKPVSIVTIILVPRELDRPVRSYQAERVPPLVPAVADLVPLQNHVFHADPFEFVAHGQARLARSDYDSLNLLHCAVLLGLSCPWVVPLFSPPACRASTSISVVVGHADLR